MPSTNPVAQKAVSERPAPLDVTKPTEPAEKGASSSGVSLRETSGPCHLWRRMLLSRSVANQKPIAEPYSDRDVKRKLKAYEVRR